MKNKILYLVLCLMLMTVLTVQSKRLGKSRGSSSSRGSRTHYKPQPSPTSLSYPQPVPKPSFTGWQQNTAPKTHSTNSKQSRPPSQTHSYPVSQTGLSGANSPKQSPTYQEAVQKSHSYPQTSGASGIPSQQSHNQQPSHGYPSSNGLSGTGTSGQRASGTSNHEARNQQPSHTYPSGNGLSGSAPASGYPSQQGSGISGSVHQNPQYKQPDMNPQGNRGMYPQNNVGNNYYSHNQGPPPPYPGNVGPNYGGHSGYGYNHNSGYGGGIGQQMPGYFGNYANNGKGFGGVSRPSSALTGLGIAGAGVGTILTGLALWNLARATGNHHHKVIYERGQPVAVEPSNDTNSAIDSWLADLVNCSLTISNTNTTEILAIPCAIAASFSPEADVKDTHIKGNNNEDTTKCIVSVLNKSGKEYMTTIPCSVLLSTAAENNVTEAPLPVNDMININNVTNVASVENITSESIAIHDNITMVRNIPEIIPVQNSSYESIPSIDWTNSTEEIQYLGCEDELGHTKDQVNLCTTATQNVTVIPPVNFN